MLRGHKTGRIKTYSEHHHPCHQCKSFNLSVAVYREYFHVFFIPVLAYGPKTAKIWCRDCGAPNMPPDLQMKYEKMARTPIYYYTVPILFVLSIVAAVFAAKGDRKDMASYMNDPQVGDVYTVRTERNDSTFYYFMKVASISKDTVITRHNTLEYYRYVSKLNPEDYFTSEEELYFTKKELKKMFDDSEISTVTRSYGSYEGFDRDK